MPISADKNRVKVLILYKSTDTDIAEQISLVCKVSASDVILSAFESSWRKDLYADLAESDVIIAVVGRDFFKYASAVFTSGYATGRNHPLILFKKERYRLPDFMKTLPSTGSIRSLTGLLQEELEKSEYKERRKRAKEALKAMGIPFTPDAFMEAVREGETGAVEQFLSAGFSPDLTDDRGVPLLCAAARNGHRGVVKMLLDSGADINAVSGDRGNTALMDAAAEKNIEIVRDLIEAGADLDVKSKTGQSALILATGQKAEDIAVLLIESGASTEAEDGLGMNAAKYAKLYNLTGVLELLETDVTSS